MRAYELDHIQKLRPYLAECMVLLKCNGAFPLDGPCRIAAFGNGVRNTVKGGTGSGEVNSRYFVSIEQGLEQAGFTITNKSWSDEFAPYLERAKNDMRASVIRTSFKHRISPIAIVMGATPKQPEYQIDLDLTADAAIYVVARVSGEGNDRLPDKGDFQLTESEVRDILALDEAYERFMLIVNAGGPVDLSRVMGVGNILVASQLGVEMGAAVADVLLGESYPSGKLATTWAAYGDYCSIGDFAQWDDTRYREGIFVGYRYFDAVRQKPLFPFGYGLGYTTFSVELAGFDCVETRVVVAVEVANTGSFKGKETVQVYVSCPRGKLVREVKSLVGFAKTRELAPGERDEVTVEFDVRDLAGYDCDSARYILEAGTYFLLVGASSADARPCATFSLDRETTVKQVRSLFGTPDFQDAQLICDRDFIAEGLPRIELDPDAFDAQVVSYAEPDIGIPEVEYLSDEELAYLGMGAFDPTGGVLGVVGNAAQSVAGAAGESTLQLRNLGIDGIVMADGPAGLRLARQYYETDEGAKAVGLPFPESMLDSFPHWVKCVVDRLTRPGKDVVLLEQYATALPIATAIAQSFNLEFAELCGDIVGAEMDEFGVDLWLAPVLNVHRNVLGGRNFECYSEDPLVIGKCAAAVARGVKAHPGRDVTIKHFAANNQETNRYANNSMVSERALREIYLKGFEICIRESKPRALMTSYNLINGVHTSESRDLAMALRCEFGFDGIIMTDWLVQVGLLTHGAKHAPADPAKVAAAGCSLYMPGSKEDHASLLAGLREGRVTRAQLERNAAYLLRTIWELQAHAPK